MARYDGKDNPVSGSPDFETVALPRIKARTVASTRKKGGKVVQTWRSVVSKDGKRLTSTARGTNAKGSGSTISRCSRGSTTSAPPRCARAVHPAPWPTARGR
jgi:hypothetical protein